MIEAVGLQKSYGRKPVLRGLSLRVAPREITLLVGPNGAGKSTTLKILAGLVRPDGGGVRVSGHDLLHDRLAVQRALAYLPQNPAFHPHFTCRQILEFYASLRGTGRDRIGFALESTGLQECTTERAGALSGGMRQRLGLAVLLLPDAPVLLLDEPGLSLDPSWRRRLQDILHGEARAGKTILVTTHLIAEWNGVAHRCLLCRDGQIAREADPANLPVDAEDFATSVAQPAAFPPEVEVGA